jgi:hypothetical protein
MADVYFEEKTEVNNNNNNSDWFEWIILPTCIPIGAIFVGPILLQTNPSNWTYPSLFLSSFLGAIIGIVISLFIKSMSYVIINWKNLTPQQKEVLIWLGLSSASIIFSVLFWSVFDVIINFHLYLDKQYPQAQIPFLLKSYYFLAGPLLSLTVAIYCILAAERNCKRLNS